MKKTQTFTDLPALAKGLRQELERKKIILLYAYNGTGKTRLSMAFKDLGKKTNEYGETIERDTLYFNAFTEDLFTWDNDLENDQERVLRINKDSHFFDGLEQYEMDSRIRSLMSRYADFDFRIDTEKWEISFSRTIKSQIKEETVEGIKISRGEENIFIWCFFLVILQFALEGEEPYEWVKYVYIDDPISSLDEHNAIVVANHLIQLLRENESKIRIVISTHHNLFFNVLHYEQKNYFRNKSLKYVLSCNRDSSCYQITELDGDTPSFYHVTMLMELQKAINQGKIEMYHFNILRTIMEKTALFHGYKHFSSCIKRNQSDADGILHQRFVDLLSHGKYSLFETNEMSEDMKGYFSDIFKDFLDRYPFNADLFKSIEDGVSS